MGFLQDFKSAFTTELARSASGLMSSGPSAASGDLSNPQYWLVDFFMGAKTRSGQRVTPNSALTLSAYWAALRSISEDIAKLPVQVYSSSQDFSSRELLYNHPVWRLFNVSPNEEMTPMTFRETMTHWALAWGGGFAEIERTKARKPLKLWPIHPSRIVMTRNKDDKIIYTVRANYSADLMIQSAPFVDVDLEAEDMFHLHGLGPAGNTGYSVLRLAIESIGLSLSAQSFGATFFGNGTSVNGVLTHPQTLKPEAYQRLRESWSQRYQGPNNSNKPAILEEGMTWTPTSVPPEEAQFLQTRQFQIEEIARWFRMPPHKLQQLLRATFSNIESQNIEYACDCLHPWCTRWNQETKRKLLVDAGESMTFIEHDMRQLLKGDMATRTKYYQVMTQIGALCPDEVRAEEGMNPIPDGSGKKFCVQINLTTLEKLGEDPEPEPAPEPTDPEEPEEADGKEAKKPAKSPPAKKAATKNRLTMYLKKHSLSYGAAPRHLQLNGAANGTHS